MLLWLLSLAALSALFSLRKRLSALAQEHGCVGTTASHAGMLLHKTADWPQRKVGVKTEASKISPQYFVAWARLTTLSCRHCWSGGIPSCVRVLALTLSFPESAVARISHCWSRGIPSRIKMLALPLPVVSESVMA